MRSEYCVFSLSSDQIFQSIHLGVIVSRLWDLLQRSPKWNFNAGDLFNFLTRIRPGVIHQQQVRSSIMMLDNLK
jgi:hypothetical protein